MEFVEYEAGRCYTVHCDSHGTRYISRYVFEPVDGQTRVTMDFQAKPVTVAARLLSPLGRIMMNSVEKCMRADLDDLKAVAEAMEEKAAETA